MKPIQILISILLVALSVRAQTPTWSENIACIVYTRCASCHNPNGIAPFSLLTYPDAFVNSGMIASAVNNGIMPPWPPAQDFQRYAHERTITQEEIDLINAWFNGGAPEGNPANAPEPPVFTGSSVLPQIDLTLKMPDYTNTADEDDYRCFVMDPNLSEDVFITGWEALPGNRGMVHHMLVFQDTTGQALNLDSADPGPGYTSFGGIGTSGAILIGGWVPGSTASFMPQGMGIKLFKNALVVMQIHYPEGTDGGLDSTRINMMLSSDPNIRTVRLAPILNHQTSLTNGPLYIPADEVKTFHAEFTLPMVADVTVLSAGPHMHLIGTSIMSYAVTPANDTINFINILKWDFHWQGSYGFRQPLKVPMGSTLYADATYDNTTNNHHNPNNPPQDVSLGEATTDEMMLVYFAFLPYLAGDENIVIDTSSATETHNDCNYKLATAMDVADEETSIRIFPNPAGAAIHISSSSPEILTAELHDVFGKLVFSKQVSTGNTKVELSEQPKGMYFIRLVNQHRRTVLNERIVRM